MKTIIFTISDKEYGLDIAHVQEVIRVRKFIPIPESADFVEGVMSLRGKVITLINLRKKLGLTAKDIGKTDRIIVTHIKDHSLGIIVDTVSGVLNIESSIVTSPDDTLKNAVYLKGIAKVGSRLIMIMDLAGLFSNESIATLNKVKDHVELRRKS
ncbi:MAG: chemotaxis protein CheW [Candidatus Omnitrophica bacterium]|nr:chemotaxis protein CheW [Candidatus Omnitrophota bacterium]